ncbi:glycosyltransferase family 4 protein [Salimicrobium halophilum]|uniref:Glycosyltransferase involved in cell wall bisynthesis n=1 Tax=Salimicrobium halophilum TaxID=86666 RepID=A0A1G8UHA9_9BACI|nr:glycosyltransferase family 4 protein [Salimicrobium halophilum]SDJ53148.1 Glycosyltransferase involved in cell wall bisynthesis [Salimicrobium halophilum]
MSKVKIGLITDRDNWAFANHAKQLKKHLGEDFDFTIVSFDGCNKNADELHTHIKDCDILHFFWREIIPYIPLDRYKDKLLSTAVYDHLFLGERSIKKRKPIFHNFHYYVCSERLYEIYKQIDAYPDPIMIIEDGVDPDLFYPQNMERFERQDRPLKVGWVGNSKWSISIEDFKGFRTFVQPVVSELMKEGHPVEGIYADRVKKMIPHEEMVDYYATIDVLICMSKIEGTPDPVLEAMACGVPVISTDVGVVPQVLGEKQKEFVLKSRDEKALRDAIISLTNNREKLHELSMENMERIKDWYWAKQSRKFKTYFDQLIDEHR